MNKPTPQLAAPVSGIQTGYIMRLLYIALTLLVCVHVFGTVGYMWLTDHKYSWFDCFYMTFITVATIGFGEIIDMTSNPPARVFTVIIGILGAGNLSMLFSVVTVVLLETDLNGTLRSKRMEKNITRLKGHYILCGFGRVGRNTSHELEATHRHFVAIDEDYNRLAEHREKNPGFLSLHADASDDDVLLTAGIKEAQGVFAITGDDSRNLMIVITARQLNPMIRIVARCNETRNIEKMRKAGADAIVSPDFTGGMRIASAMVRPHVVSFLDEMLKSEHNLRIEEIAVPADFKPRMLGSLPIEGCNHILLAVRLPNGNWQFNPDKHFALEPGHTLIAMANPLGRQEVLAALIEAAA
ncbi:MAG: potassium channel family protein [Azonexus sp.]|nr:potassium channel family protein [Azonexus sp.]